MMTSDTFFKNTFNSCESILSAFQACTELSLHQNPHVMPFFEFIELMDSSVLFSFSKSLYTLF